MAKSMLVALWLRGTFASDTDFDKSSRMASLEAALEKVKDIREHYISAPSETRRIAAGVRPYVGAQIF